MSDPLWQRILLLVIDKLVLAGILAWAVLAGQRRLEGYKARQGLKQGLVMLRIDEVAKLCHGLSKIELALDAIETRYWAIIFEQAPIAAKAAPIAQFTTPDEQFKSLFGEAVGRIATAELVPRLERVRVDLSRLAGQVAQPTFWVPESVTQLLNEHIHGLTSLLELQEERLVKKRFVPPGHVDATMKLVLSKRLTLDTVLERLGG